jgi:WD40 repeat protein
MYTRSLEHSDEVKRVAWSHDGALLATACADGNVRPHPEPCSLNPES